MANFFYLTCLSRAVPRFGQLRSRQRAKMSLRWFSCQFTRAEVVFAQRRVPAGITRFSLPLGLRKYSTDKKEPDYFALFPETFPKGGPPNVPFLFDVKQLRKEFLKLQSKFHPDYAQNDSDKLAEYEEKSSLLNKAYSTLKTPLQRALFILRQRGIDLDNEQKNEETEKQGPGAIAKYTQDQEVLLEVLEVHEAIEEAETEEDIANIRAENQLRIASCEQKLDEAFRDNNEHDAVKYTVLLRYWISVDNALRNWEPGKPVLMNH